jgi:hypothetical protein
MMWRGLMPRKQGTKLDLLQRTLDMMVMRTLLAGRQMDMRSPRPIERLSDDVLAVDHRSLYPALHRLEKNGQVGGKWEMSSTKRRARYYRLTAAERKRLSIDILDGNRWPRLLLA